VLSKGLIGLVLPAATVVAYALWQRDWGFILRMRPFAACHPAGDHRALVHRGIDRQPRIPALLFHPRAFRALPDQGPRPLPAGLVLHPILLLGMMPWLGSLAAGALAAGMRKRSRPRFSTARFLLAWTVRGLWLLLRVQFQTRLLHPAHLPQRLPR
jgi:4-amino-4-deoxy-L-arabinose transferase-like glycosyltransferase